MTGPRSEPPMPMLMRFLMRLPVWPFQLPLRTRSAKPAILSSTAWTWGTTFSPSTVIDALIGARRAEEAVWTAIRYLEAHAEAGHLSYASFRKRGVARGSGAIESAIRRVINLRLKGPGLLWEEEQAEGMLALRAAVLTERWQQTLEHVEETMATDRRIDWQWRSPDMAAELKAHRPVRPPSPQELDRQQAATAAA